MYNVWVNDLFNRVKKGKFVPKFVTGQPTAKAQRTPSSMSPSRGGHGGGMRKYFTGRLFSTTKSQRFFKNIYLYRRPAWSSLPLAKKCYLCALCAFAVNYCQNSNERRKSNV